MTSFLVLLLVATLQSVAPGQPSGSEKPAGPVFHLTVSGDIECIHDVQNIRAVLTEAASARAPLAVIVFSGNDTRLDLVWELGKTIRESRIPIAVFLADQGDKEVGPGQLCLGLLTTSCAIAPGTTIRGVPNSSSLAALAPENTAWAALTSELVEWIQKSTSAHPLPDNLAAAIVSPTGPLWAVFDGNVAHLSPQTSGADSAPIITEVRGTPQFAMASKTASRLKLADEAPNWSALVTKQGIKSTARTDRTITTGLAQPSQRVKVLIERIDLDEDQLKVTLKLPAPESKKVSVDAYHNAAAKAKPVLDDATGAITELEALLNDYPELMRRPAPDQTEVGNKPSAYAARWRALVQTRKDRVAKLASSAEKFAQVKD